MSRKLVLLVTIFTIAMSTGCSELDKTSVTTDDGEENNSVSSEIKELAANNTGEQNIREMLRKCIEDNHNNLEFDFGIEIPKSNEFIKGKYITDGANIKIAITGEIDDRFIDEEWYSLDDNKKFAYRDNSLSECDWEVSDTDNSSKLTINISEIISYTFENFHVDKREKDTTGLYHIRFIDDEQSSINSMNIEVNTENNTIYSIDTSISAELGIGVDTNRFAGLEMTDSYNIDMYDFKFGESSVDIPDSINI